MDIIIHSLIYNIYAYMHVHVYSYMSMSGNAIPPLTSAAARTKYAVEQLPCHCFFDAFPLTVVCSRSSQRFFIFVRDAIIQRNLLIFWPLAKLFFTDSVVC
jgi:hypothetical protein